MKSLSKTSSAGRTTGGEHATAASTDPTIGFGRSNSPALRQFVATGDGGGIDAMMERVTDLLNEETGLLRAHNIDQLAVLTERKGQALLELTRLLRNNSPLRADHSMAAKLERFRGAIAANQRTLKCHMEAAAELSRILTRAIEDDMSDGTYSAAICRECYGK